MFIEPLQLPPDEIDLVVRFSNAVAFARVADEDGFDAALLQRAIVSVSYTHLTLPTIYSV